MKLEDYTDAEIIEGIDIIGQQYGEISSQHASECALYGDSWAGAESDIHDTHQRLKAFEREAERRGLNDGEHEDIEF